VESNNKFVQYGDRRPRVPPTNVQQREYPVIPLSHGLFNERRKSRRAGVHELIINAGIRTSGSCFNFQPPRKRHDERGCFCKTTVLYSEQYCICYDILHCTVRTVRCSRLSNRAKNGAVLSALRYFTVRICTLYLLQYIQYL
jgi:hypothetical protein